MQPVTTTTASLSPQAHFLPVSIQPNISDTLVTSVACGCRASSKNHFSDDIVAGEFNETFCCQRQKSIDNPSLRAAVASWSEATSIEDLIGLIRTYTEPMDRIWLVFYWITQNISYGDKSGVNQLSAEEVFKVRVCVCAGYATLFEYLSNGVGVPCTKVSGLAKGRGYVKKPFLGSLRWNMGYYDSSIRNHAWNAVRLGDRCWYLVDSTWGSGNNSSTNLCDFRRELNTHYFLSRPEQLLYSHLPSNVFWQLVPVSERVSYDVFVRRPKVWSTYFDLQLQVVEPANSSELIFDRKRSMTELLIRAPADVVISTTLEINNIETPSELSFVQFLHERQVWQCLFIAQQHGRHTVIIFGHRQNSSDNGKCAMKFHFNAPLIRSFKHTIFPKTYSRFSTDKCELFEPLEGQLKQGSQVTIHCRVADVISVRLILDENDWLPEDGYDKETGHFKKTITVPKQKIRLNVKDDKNSSNYSTLLLYTVI